MKNENLSCVPKVRFPGFQDPWKVVYGNDIFATVSEKNGGAELSLLALSQELGAIPRSMIDYHVLVSEVSKANYKVVRAGDFIISLRSFQGGIEYSCYDGLCSPAYIVLRNRVPISHLFYKYFFKTTGLISALNRNLEGIRDGKMVSYKQFSEIRIPYPSLDEQHKIASCLSSIDDVIKETEEKVCSLKEHKKGLADQLFSGNEGWQNGILRNIVTVISPIKGLSSDRYREKGAYPIIDQSKQFICGFTDDDSYLVNRGCESLIIFGDHTCIVKFVDFPFAQGADGIKVLSVSEKNIDVRYLFQFLKCHSIPSQEYKRHFSELKEMYVPFPQIIQQRKIASCLSSIDDIITAYKEKLTLLKLHKKGLLQQLFPQMNFNQ